LRENSIADNKFLIEYAGCNLSSSENYAIAEFWEKVPKNEKKSFKLKVLANLNQAPKLSPDNEQK